ncbi:hypothetical protein F6S08_18485 [Pseudomonas sp. JV449]|uniref:hypothetical protein n=1 Tax=Pseudomonas sp. JV449 TaxID=1890658 RepID=UPI0028E0D0D5|nr:hypothetical protein [Pseudomonas sp. JV449]MDT9633205.1 hypothetical protein [Pseudomonas sp. JV449]
MHPSFQERIDELRVLLQQTNAARAAFFSRTDRPMPKQPVRYQVTGESVGMFQIVDLATGKTHAFRQAYKAAHDLAMQFEAASKRVTLMAQENDVKFADTPRGASTRSTPRGAGIHGWQSRQVESKR